MSYAEAFEAAFADPKNTAIFTPDADVNAIIKASYNIEEPFIYTKTQLWDMEVKKAHFPDKYIRHVVRPGSLHTFNHTKEGHFEYFIRVTDQRKWKDPAEYATIIERVCLDHANQKAYFLGIEEVGLPDGRKMTSGKKQPLFHVEHCAVGNEERPINTWRIVHLTDGRDDSLVAALKDLGRDPFLRLFNEVYIREDLKKKLVRKDITA
ncbi:hypothetical protein FALBO_8027 [Fusarium albosuccineum]|uniref:Uncharacterized protein n=1 Tax=Fusarium albosuccineum TaxID=1237068 RepID=A0A8H4L8N9_9HYPO|nr:hypothetical protein FALBO_8027 [Fusarium albosuccineum]